MRVLHIITSLYDGGAEGVLYRLCCNDKFNQHVIVSLRDQGKYGKLLLKHGIKIYSLNMNPGKFSFKALFKLIKIIKNEKAEIVQTWLYHSDFFGGIAARLAGVRNLIWNIRHSNFDEDDTKKSLKILIKILAKLSYFLPKKIIICSKRSIKIHKEYGYDEKKIIYVANGFDLNKFRPDSIQKFNFRKKFNFKNNLPILGNVARYHPQKDHKNLLKALYFLKKDKYFFKCILVGHNINKKNKILLNLVKKYKLENEVIFLGQERNINHFMNGIDIYILSSKYGEAFPNVVGEAMASETPCVVTDVGDSSLIVDKTGWIVKPNNPKKLASNLKSAINYFKTNRWVSICKNTRKRIYNKFSIKNMIESYTQVWKEISTNNFNGE